MLQQTPIFCDVAKPFFYAVQSQGNSGTISIGTAGGSNFGYVNLKPGSYFVFSALRAVTNYDNFGAPFRTADVVAPILPSPSFVPNNFTVQIARGQNSTYSNIPLSQAEICSSGYLGGNPNPFPIVYGPRFNFAFTFTDTTGLFRVIEGADTVIPLEIQMFMCGYNVPEENWPRFLKYFPALNNVFGA